MQPLLRAAGGLLCGLALLTAAACTGSSDASEPPGPPVGEQLGDTAVEAGVLPGPPPAPAEPATGQPAEPAPPGLAERPAWLGTRVLPLRADGFGEIVPTPPELDDRRLPPPPGGLPAPASAEFAATVQPVSDPVAARSTWSPDCPVAREDLRYVTVTFWGFDDRPHTGELLVHASVADAMVGVFRRIYDARFPIEEMRLVGQADLDAPPTGDGNNTTSFVCRSTVASGSWSQHAFGLAVDINPFHNPYARADVVLPELASSYVDRGRHRPGMIQPGDVVTDAFTAIGWPWGGDWRSAKDWMHFSRNGR